MTGTEPFAVAQREGVGSALRRIGAEPYPKLHHAGVPHDMAAFLEGALSKDPTDRPASAAAFGGAINELRRAHGLTPVPVRTEHRSTVEPTVVVAESDRDATRHSAVESNAPHRVRRSTGRRTGRVLMLQAALVAMLVAAAVLVWSGVGTSATHDILAAATLPEPTLSDDSVLLDDTAADAADNDATAETGTDADADADADADRTGDGDAGNNDDREGRRDDNDARNGLDNGPPGGRGGGPDRPGGGNGQGNDGPGDNN